MISIDEAILIIKEMDDPGDSFLEFIFAVKNEKIGKAKYEGKKEIFEKIISTLENLRDYPQVWEQLLPNIRHKNKPECIENAKWV